MWCRKAGFFSQVRQESKKKDHQPQSFFSLMFAGSLKWTLCFDIGGSGLCKSLCKKEIESESFHLGTLCSNWLGPNLNSAKCQKVADGPKLISRVNLDYLTIFHHPPSSSKGLRSWRRMEWFLAVWIYPTQIYHRHSLFPGFVFFITSTKQTPRISDYSFALWPKNTHIYSLSHYPCPGSRLICLIWQHQQHLNPVSYVDFCKGGFVRLFYK